MNKRKKKPRHLQRQRAPETSPFQSLLVALAVTAVKGMLQSCATRTTEPAQDPVITEDAEFEVIKPKQLINGKC